MPARRAGRSRLASNGVEVHIDPFWHEENGYSGPHAGEAFPGRKKEAENVPVKAVGRRWAYTRQDFRRAVNVKPAGAGSQLRKAPGSPPLVGMPWFGSSADGIIRMAKTNRPVPCPGCGNRLAFLHGAARTSPGSRCPMFRRSIWQWLNKNHDGF